MASLVYKYEEGTYQISDAEGTCPTQSEELTIHIVKCVNSHEELVKAIEYVFASGRPLLTKTAIHKLRKALKGVS